MMIVRRTLLALYGLSTLLSAMIVVHSQSSPIVLAMYLVSVVAWPNLLTQQQQSDRRSTSRPVRLDRVDRIWICALVAGQLSIAGLLAHAPRHFHPDEFVTAYTSYMLPRIDRIDWFAGYPAEGERVAQFLSLFFVLQKPILMLLGPPVESIRVSIWPYLVLIIVYLYLLVRELAPHRYLAPLGCIVAITFAPNLYISSLGGHIVSSTAFLVASMYYLVVLLRTGRASSGVLCGIFAGLAYLTYPSSYITLSLIVGIMVAEAFAHRSLDPLVRAVPVLIMALVVVLPFVTFAAITHNDFT